MYEEDRPRREKELADKKLKEDEARRKKEELAKKRRQEEDSEGQATDRDPC